MNAPFQRIGTSNVQKVFEMDLNGMTFGQLLPDLPEQARRDHPDWFPKGTSDAEGHAYMSLHAWLVRHDDRLILIDTGAGNEKPRPQQRVLHDLSNPFLARLAALGVAPEDIDVVLHTHIHSDHVGWDTRLIDGDWRPTFPNAEIVVSALEYDYGAALTAGDDAAIRAVRARAGLGEPVRVPVAGTFADSIAPLEGRVPIRRVTVDGAEALSDGTATVRWNKILQGIPPAGIDSIFADSGETSSRDTSINAYLIDTGTQRILIDAGAGPLFGACCGRLPQVLAEAGYPAATIGAVLLTHVHGDHSGGLTVDGKRVFSKATVHLAQREYDYWMSAAEEARADPTHRKMFVEGRAALAPYAAAGKLRFFTAGDTLPGGIATIAAPGHTPGHNFYRLARGADSVVFVGDIIHAAEVQFGHPDVTAAFDADQARARATRKEALATFARTHQFIAADHVSFPGIGHVIRDGNTYAWAPLPYRATVLPAKPDR